MTCWGEGSPTVFLESGGGALDEFTDSGLVRALAAQQQVCLYNRAGREPSDPAPNEPREAEDAAADFHALVEAAGIEPPHILFGRSFGGILVTFYAATYPEQVAGVVVFDSPAPSADMTLEDFPEGVWDHPGNLEHLNVLRGYENRFGKDPVQLSVPLVLISPTAGEMDPEDDYWLQTSPGATQVVLEGGRSSSTPRPSGSRKRSQRWLRRTNAGPPPRLAVRPGRPPDAHHFLVRDAGQEVGHRDIGPEVGTVAPGAQPGVELRQRLQRKASLLEAGVRDDQVQVHVRHAQAVEGQDVQVDGASAEALGGRLAAERGLQPLQVGQQVARAEVHLQLQGGVGEDRLIQEVAGRGLVQARDARDHPNAFQLAYGADKGLTRVAQIAPQTDEGAHAPGLYPMQVPELAHRLQRATHMEPMQLSRIEKALIMAAFLPFLAIGLLVLFA